MRTGFQPQNDTEQTQGEEEGGGQGRRVWVRKRKCSSLGGNIKNKTEELVVGTRVVGPINDPQLGTYSHTAEVGRGAE